MKNHPENKICHSLIKQNTRELSQQMGRVLYELRCSEKVSLKKLARMTQINRDYLEKLEMGICMMQLYHIVRIAAAFNLSPQDFLTRV